MSREGKLQEKLAHVRGELKRARARIEVLELDKMVLHQDWQYVCGKLAALEGRPMRADADPSYGNGYREITAKPAGYEHLTWPTIRAIQASTSKGQP